jgi:hypothetical protein
MLESKKVSLIDTKRKCSVTGCPNLGAWSRNDNGKVYRAPLCDKHKNLRWGKKNKSWRPKWMHEIGIKPCSICGWDRDRVDAHRVVHGKDGGSYTQANTIGLCPNCHRLVHHGKIIL